MGHRARSVVQGGLIVGSGFLILTLMYGTLYSFGVFLKPLVDDLHLAQRALSGAYSLCFLLSGILAMPVGRLNDRIGPRVVVCSCAVLIGLGWFLSSRAGALWQLYLYFGVLVGVGTSGGLTPVLSTIAKRFATQRGIMTGIAVAGVSTGTMLLPPLMNTLLEAYGWRTTFALTGFGVPLLVLVLAQVLAWKPRMQAPEPLPASATGEPVAARPATGVSVRHACRTRYLWMMFAVYVLAGFVIQIVLVHLAFHAIQGGTAAAQAAVLVSAVGFGGLSGRIVGGIASDRLGNRPTMMAAFVLMAVAFALLLLPATWGVLLAFSIIFGVAYGEVLCMMSLLPVDFFGLKNHGTIMGIITAASTIGGGLGPVVAGSLFDATGNYRIAWAVCLGFTVLAFLLVVGLRPQGLSTLKSTGAGSS